MVFQPREKACLVYPAASFSFIAYMGKNQIKSSYERRDVYNSTRQSPPSGIRSEDEKEGAMEISWGRSTPTERRREMSRNELF